jgi:hypothetical protein
MLDVAMEMSVHLPPAPPMQHYDRQKNLYPRSCQENEKEL